MAPEVYFGKPEEYVPTKPADTYSFSMMMYEVLTGVRLTKPLPQGMLLVVCCSCLMRLVHIQFFFFFFQENGLNLIPTNTNLAKI